MITHNPEAAEYGDRIIHMRDGEIVTPGRRSAVVAASSGRSICSP